MRPSPPLRLLAILTCLALLLPATAVAQDQVGLEVDAVSEGQSVSGGEVTPSQLITLVANVTAPERENTTWRGYLNATLDGAPVEPENSTVQQIEDGGRMGLALQFAAPNTTGAATLDYTVTVQSRSTSEGGNATTQNGTDGNETGGNQTQGNTTAGWTTAEGFPEQGQITFTVAELAPPPEPGLPWGWIVAGGAILVGGIGAYAWLTRDKQIRGRARSKAMQDLEGDSFEAEQTAEPEVHPQVKILEARAQDIRRLIEMTRERHERGDLTEHQFEMIREKKEAELEEIEEELSEYRGD